MVGLYCWLHTPVPESAQTDLPMEQRPFLPITVQLTPLMHPPVSRGMKVSTCGPTSSALSVAGGPSCRASCLSSQALLRPSVSRIDVQAKADAAPNRAAASLR